jgi:hypothetical protein
MINGLHCDGPSVNADNPFALKFDAVEDRNTTLRIFFRRASREKKRDKRKRRSTSIDSNGGP